MCSAAVGYCVEPNPQLASYRLRVDLPRQHLGLDSHFGIGDCTFFYKDGHPVAKKLRNVVYDVVNDHFNRESCRQMADSAKALTCASEAMREVVRVKTGRQATVIPDPYENWICKPKVWGKMVLWFGHNANISTLKPVDHLTVLTGPNWSIQSEREALEDCAVVYLTGKDTASANRVIKAIRAGRFVVTPGGVPSWEEWKDHIWIGDPQEGIAWALTNPEEACAKIAAGQQKTEQYSPENIAAKWTDLFASTLGLDTKKRPVGSA